MFSRHDCGPFDDNERMRSALNQLPVPKVSHGFNERIHFELNRNDAASRRLWPTLRVAALGVCSSFAVTLFLLALVSREMGLSGTHSSAFPGVTASVQAGRSDDAESVAEDILIQRADLTSASLRTLAAPAAADTDVPGSSSQPETKQATANHRLQGA